MEPQAPAAAERREMRVRLVPSGLAIGDEVVPLWAGSVHYWRHDPSEWRVCLSAIKDLGLRLVDLYVPWSVHETSPGVLELGQTDPRRDVAAFLRLAHELGLYAIVRPGPHINAELTCFGIPDRIVWDTSCQAQSPSGAPVVLPMVPAAFPVPSYASEAFHDEVARFFEALAPALAPLRWPEGPIVMLQIDNEGALYFRDGAYDQDYHPDSISLYRAFLREKYPSLVALGEAYGEVDGAAPLYATVPPPRRFDARTTDELARHLDWCEFQEHLLAGSLTRFARALARAGLGGLPTSHNFPMAQEATPLNAARIGRAVDLVGLDYYYPASPSSRAIIARRTSELAVRCEAQGAPAFACEMGAGFAPFFPPLDERDSAFTMLAALAYGLRGFNLYMAVERDRWIGAPIDPHGVERPFAVFWRQLVRALDVTRFHTLSRPTPVRLLTPRSERRLRRAMHAFGPLPATFFSIIGSGAREACLEDDLGTGYPIALESDACARAFEEALGARGVPFAHIGGEDRDVALAGARWVVCVTSGALHPELARTLEQARAAGTRVTLGPRAPTLDGSFRALPHGYDVARLATPGSDVPVLVAGDPAHADAAVAAAVAELSLPVIACDPADVSATVHEDAEGRARVLFVLHPGEGDTLATIALGERARVAVDLFDEATHEVKRGTLELRMRPWSVRMLALS